MADIPATTHITVVCPVNGEVVDIPYEHYDEVVRFAKVEGVSYREAATLLGVEFEVRGVQLKPGGGLTTVAAAEAAGIEWLREALIQYPMMRSEGDLTPITAAVICRNLELGASIEAAAAMANVPVKKVQHWLAEGEYEDSPQAYREFAGLAALARARFETKNLESIQAAGKKQWRANAWLLSKVRPDRYGENVVGKSDNEIVVRFEWGTGEEIEGEARVVKEKLAGLLTGGDDGDA